MNHIIKAMVALQSEAPKINKGTKGQIGKRTYMYANLDDIIEAIKPLLVKYKLVVLQKVATEGVNTIIYHESGEFIESGFYQYDSSKTQTSANLSNMQKEGICITYAKRYQLAAMLNINTEEDIDGDIGGVKEEPQKAWFNDKEYNQLEKGNNLIKQGKKDIEDLKAWLDTFKISKDMRKKIDNLNIELLK
jgi:hypothetical protein